MAPVPRRLTEADRLRALEEQVRMANLRAGLSPGPATQRALARERQFTRSGWARVPATVIAAVAGSISVVAAELAPLPLQLGAVGALALGTWWGQPSLERACRSAFSRRERGQRRGPSGVPARRPH